MGSIPKRTALVLAGVRCIVRTRKSPGSSGYGDAELFDLTEENAAQYFAGDPVFRCVVLDNRNRVGSNIGNRCKAIGQIGGITQQPERCFNAPLPYPAFDLVEGAEKSAA